MGFDAALDKSGSWAQNPSAELGGNPFAGQVARAGCVLEFVRGKIRIESYA